MKINATQISPMIGGTLLALLLAGCVPKIPTPKVPDQNVSRTQWHDSSYVDENYHLKPEPYSLDSDQKDPELLGPQSTLKQPLESEIEEERVHEEESGDGTFLSKDESPKAPPATAHSAMTRSRCISLIGKSKYNQYTKQFGSEEAALRKCTILERVQKQ
ncbi:hypothetical protein [Nitratifractor sp.]|uniref:hypothetical protein n=1 Tax=Nitratifractor sp. TaxID=2268144 RepID=UPI0025E085B6|nr:hypothetical protein [Nitratifractor sp.]